MEPRDSGPGGGGRSEKLQVHPFGRVALFVVAFLCSFCDLSENNCTILKRNPEKESSDVA